MAFWKKKNKKLNAAVQFCATVVDNRFKHVLKSHKI